MKAKDVFQYREEYVRTKDLIAWNFLNTQDISEQVGLIITYDLKGKKTKRIDTWDGIIRVLSKKDLTEMKKYSDRPSDDYLEQCRHMTVDQIIAYLDDFRGLATNNPKIRSWLIGSRSQLICLNPSK